ncbi:hypothetical protein ACFFK0_22205 [Paenibacillus chartarius]|uniref:Uncharacterized protein n=1 Tax=Paenibacillus chartarius TaxID=747481 RepID=A0ABV6DR30_9BACL
MKKSILTLTTAAALLLSATSVPMSVWAADGQSAVGSVPAPAPAAIYKLSDAYTVELIGLTNERTEFGTRLGAVVRYTNNSASLARIPDDELRVTASDGTVYTLTGSATNARAVPAKSSQVLTYMLTVDRQDDLALTGLAWVNVDMYTYPKTETMNLQIDVTGREWRGGLGAAGQSAKRIAWGDTFALEGSPLQYRTVSLNTDTSGAKPVTTVKLLVTNPGFQRETAPSLSLEATDGISVYSGTQAEKAPVAVEAGGQAYVHIAVPTDIGAQLTTFTLIENYTFAVAGGTAAASGSTAGAGAGTGTGAGPGTGAGVLSIGRISFDKPAESAAVSTEWKLGERIALDPMNKLIHPGMEVSLVELHVAKNEEDSYQTGIVKLRLANGSGTTLAAPNVAVSLVDRNGSVYPGSRQAAVTPQIVPNAATALSYSFKLPLTVSADDLKLQLFDAQTIAPYQSLLAEGKVEAQSSLPDNMHWSLYPLQVNNNGLIVQNSLVNGMYSYQIKLDAEIVQQPDSMLDASTSRLQFDLYDSAGRLVGSTANVGFTGAGHLVNGDNVISVNASTNQLAYPVTVRVYETFVDSNNETAKRLLAILQG